MKPLPRFFIAKYVPDLHRMEARNIGLFLWADSRIYCRFLDSPDFVLDSKVYRQWIEFWKAETNDELIAPLRGIPIPKTDPRCMDALMSTTDGNYMIVEAGELFHTPKSSKIDEAIDSLFRDLVLPDRSNSRQKHKAKSLKAACLQVLSRSGITDMDGFKERLDIRCPVFGVDKEMHFSFGISDDEIKMIFQVVSIDRDSSVHDAAFKMRAAIDAKLVEQRRCIALYQHSSLVASTNGAGSNKRILEKVCPLLDVDDTHNVKQYVDAVLL